MELKMRANAIMAYGFDEGKRCHTWTFPKVGSVNLWEDRLSDDARVGMFRNGIKQRVGDKAAKGQTASPEEKFAAVRALVDHYNAGGAYEMERAGPGLDRMILAAIMEALGMDEATVRARVEAGAAKANVSQQKYLNGLAKAKAVVPILERMRAAEPVAFDADADLEAWAA